jgi:hypothetical protein
MANARTKFDFIADYMIRTHEAVQAPLFGKQALMLNGEPFLVFHADSMAFRLGGKQRLQASALAGAKYWSPLNPDVPNMDWVSVPIAHVARWDRLAVDALHQRQNNFGSRPRAEPVKGPPPAPPASLRWADNIKSLLTKIQNLTLIPQEAKAPEPKRNPFL